jgi:glycosyltransferase involved in cell wall biosynthesis
MKILITSGIFPPDSGGPATFAESIAQEFILRSHRVTVVTLSELKKDHSKEETRFRLVKISRNKNKVIRILHTIWAIRRESAQAELIICTGLHQECGLALLGRKGLKIAKIVGDPVWERAVNIHKSNYSIQQFNALDNKLSLAFLLQRKLLNFCLNQFNLIIVPGSTIETIVKGWNLKPKLLKVPNAIKLKMIHSGKKISHEYDFLIISRIVKWKKIEVALRIVSNLNMSVAIIGNGPELENLSQYAENLGVNAKFLGYKSQDEISELLSQSIAFIQMSEYEGMSYSLLEAMNAEKFIVCSDLQANRDVITHLWNGFIFDENNFEYNCQLLKQILLNPLERNRITLNAKNTIQKNHNLDNQVKFFEKVLISG